MTPVPAPQAEPSHGVCNVSVPTAAPKAPISIMPSSAILVTPERSQSKPPSAAKISGVEIRKVDRRSCMVNSKHQAPSTKLQRSSNDHASIIRSRDESGPIQD